MGTSRLKRNLSATLQDTSFGESINNHHGGSHVNNRDMTIQSECVMSERYVSESRGDERSFLSKGMMSSKYVEPSSSSSSSRPNGTLKSDKSLNTNSLSTALKLTLQKSDINLIKEILKKKEKSVISDLTNLAFGGNGVKASSTTKLKPGN